MSVCNILMEHPPLKKKDFLIILSLKWTAIKKWGRKKDGRDSSFEGRNLSAVWLMIENIYWLEKSVLSHNDPKNFCLLPSEEEDSLSNQNVTLYFSHWDNVKRNNKIA